MGDIGKLPQENDTRIYFRTRHKPPKQCQSCPKAIGLEKVTNEAGRRLLEVITREGIYELPDWKRSDKPMSVPEKDVLSNELAAQANKEYRLAWAALRGVDRDCPEGAFKVTSLDGTTSIECSNEGL